MWCVDDQSPDGGCCAVFDACSFEAFRSLFRVDGLHAVCLLIFAPLEQPRCWRLWWSFVCINSCCHCPWCPCVVVGVLSSERSCVSLVSCAFLVNAGITFLPWRIA